MTNLQQFQFQSQDVRIVDKGGDPWFVAKDLCDVLMIQNITQILGKVG